MHRALIVSALFGLAAATASAQDPVKVDPAHCKVVLENQYVRVLRWTESPGDKTPMHSHPALVSISLGAGKTRFTSPDGKTQEVETTQGQATWSEPTTHSSENLGAVPGEVVQVELKTKPTAAMTALPASKDPVTLDPNHYSVVFQNARVRVLRVHYAPGEKSVMHAHPANVAVFLADGHSTFSLPGGKTSVSDVKAGQVRWSGAEQHLPENTGSVPLDLILVELR
jgi:quercetin dioxygenase-like cupin family protein